MMDSTSALDLRDIPKSLLVVGGGYIGLELGTVYAALGSKVSVVEMLRRAAARRRPRPGAALCKSGWRRASKRSCSTPLSPR